MGLKTFDRKFGRTLIEELPTEPAVYLFKDEAGHVLYAGKAKNIRRRLQSYRNASRRKVHRKMRTLVRTADSLEILPQESERDALLLENELIREHRPRYNVDGAYSFLYPAIGLGVRAGQTLIAISTRIDAFGGLGLRWYGVFRSRHRAWEAHGALGALLGRVGHVEPRSRLRDLPRAKGSQVLAYRRVETWVPSLGRFLAGENADVLPALSKTLLEKPDARREASEVGEDLRLLADFYETHARPLHEALKGAGRRGAFVSQEERDPLFIAHRHPG